MFQQVYLIISKLYGERKVFHLFSFIDNLSFVGHIQNGSLF